MPPCVPFVGTKSVMFVKFSAAVVVEMADNVVLASVFVVFIRYVVVVFDILGNMPPCVPFVGTTLVTFDTTVALKTAGLVVVERFLAFSVAFTSVAVDWLNPSLLVMFTLVADSGFIFGNAVEKTVVADVVFVEFRLMGVKLVVKAEG